MILEVDLLEKEHEMASNESDLPNLSRQCSALSQRLDEWNQCCAPAFKPASIAHISADHPPPVPVGCWPGRVDMYYDLSVSGVWNIFRETQLRLFALMLKLADAQSNIEASQEVRLKVDSVVEDLIASIPYHLSENVYEFVKHPSSQKGIPAAGKCLGGLLLLHPLHTAIGLSCIATSMRDYLQRCLVWIGLNMGMGQATFLAKVRQNYSAARFLTNDVC